MAVLLLLPLVDQKVHAQLLAPEQIEIARQTLAFVDDILAHAHQIGEIADDRVGLCAHIRQHGAQHDGGAHGLQRILGLDQKRGRRLAPDPLQRRKNFGNRGAPLVERFVNDNFSWSSSGFKRACVASMLASTSRTRAALSMSC